MGKLISLLTLTFLFVGCNNTPVECNAEDSKQTTNAKSCTTTPAPTDPVETPIVDAGEVPPGALLFNANVALTNFNPSQEEKVLKAIEAIKKVVRTKEFKERVYNFTYNGQRKFVDNKGLTNEQIYQIVINGSETLIPGNNNQMDLELELYTSNFTSTVGYTYPNVTKIWMNTKYFNSYTPAQVAGNVFHEWTHKIGFDHASSYSKARDYSVPYGLGYLMVELINKDQAPAVAGE